MIYGAARADTSVDSTYSYQREQHSTMDRVHAAHSGGTPEQDMA